MMSVGDFFNEALVAPVTILIILCFSEVTNVVGASAEEYRSYRCNNL